jgi:enamine deaminase RidA (YjgF/YER057c/UK114 family)
MSRQQPLVPQTMLLVGDAFSTRVVQVFDNLSAVCEAAGGTLAAIGVKELPKGARVEMDGVMEL